MGMDAVGDAGNRVSPSGHPPFPASVQSGAMERVQNRSSAFRPRESGVQMSSERNRGAEIARLAGKKIPSLVSGLSFFFILNCSMLVFFITREQVKHLKYALP